MDDWKKDLNPEQLNLLKMLKKEVKDVTEGRDEFFVYRFLKARKFDLKKAEEMLRNSMKWRESFGADHILSSWEPPEVMLKYWPGGVFGVDKQGHPILWQLSKGFDGKGMMKCVKKTDIIKYHVWRMEKVMKICEEQTAKRGYRVTSSMHISDLDGFSLGMVFLPGGMQDALKQVFAIVEANYPENLHSSYVINAPGVFPAIFNILKPFLSEDTKRKVHLLGRNWQEEIAKVVDPEELPVYWGGTAKVPDDKCSDHINFGCPVPQKYYISEKLGLEKDKMTTITVIRSTNYNLSYDIKYPGTVIRYAFETEGHDIGFGVFYAVNRKSYKMKKMQEVEAVTRCDSHVTLEYGTLTCQHAGVYVLQFDNTYSWVHSKTVHYDVEILEPDVELLKNGTSTNNHHSNGSNRSEDGSSYRGSTQQQSDTESLAESVESTKL